jgi:hypothetical protein
MKKFKKQTLIVISGLTMLMSAGAALSSTTSAAATIDWSTFAITGYGLGLNAAPSYTLNGQNSNTSSSVSDWVNWNGNTSNNSRSFSASTDGTGAGSGYASASRSANINILGTGFLVLSANYDINAAINENNNGGSYYNYNYDYNSASASVNFNLSNNSSISSGTSSSQANISLGTPWWYGDSTLTSDQKQGTLAVGVMVNNGDMLNFSSAVSANAHEINSIIFDPVIFGGVNTYESSSIITAGGSALYLSGSTITYNPAVLDTFVLEIADPILSPISYNLTAVPVPAALWLFSSALIGLVGLGRPRKAVMG